MVRFTPVELREHVDAFIQALEDGQSVELDHAGRVLRIQAVPSRLGAMRGTGEVVGDLVAPPDEVWEAMR